MGRAKGNDDKHTRKQLEIVGWHSHLEHDGNDKTVNDGSEDNGNQAVLETPRAKEDFPNDDRCKADDDGAYAHPHIEKAIVHANEGASHGGEGITQEKPQRSMTLVSMPWARIICGLKPVARMAAPISVPKNQ